MAHGSIGLGTAPIAIIDRHKLKSWSAISAASKHNNRTDHKLEHLVPGAPSPEFLIGSEDAHADMKAKFEKHGLKSRIKGCVLAVEMVLSAPKVWFSEGDAAARAARLEDWKKATVAHVTKTWGPHVVSVVLHLDEFSPHMHVILIPAVYGIDKRSLRYKSQAERAAARPTWKLCDRSFGGSRTQMVEMHTDYANAVAHLGLLRGVQDSGRKPKPYAEHLDELDAGMAAEVAAIKEQLVAAADQELTVARVQLRRDREQFGRERDRFEAGFKGRVETTVKARVEAATPELISDVKVWHQVEVEADEWARAERQAAEDRARAERLAAEDKARAERLAREDRERAELSARQVAAVIAAAVAAADAKVEVRVAARIEVERRRLADQVAADRRVEDADRAERLRVEEASRAEREAAMVAAVEERVHGDWADDYKANKATAAKLQRDAASMADVGGRLLGRVEAIAKIVPDIDLVQPGFTKQLPKLESIVKYLNTIESGRAERARVAERDLIQRGWEYNQAVNDRGASRGRSHGDD